MTPTPPSRQAWVILVVGVASQMAATVAITGPAFLIPHLTRELGYSLTQAGTVAVAPSFGLLLTLIAWGAFADRFGERLAMSLGLGLTALASAAAVAVAGSPILLTVAIAASGAAAASVNSASGRVVIGWFPRHRRGLAMGIRQMSQPLGTALAALTVPPIAAAGGIAAYLWFAAAVTALMTIVCVLLVRNPSPAEAAPSLVPTAEDDGVRGSAGAEETDRVRQSGGAASAGNPYRSDAFLWRIHVVSALLVVPQFAFSTYGLIWLIADQGVSAAMAGGIVAAAQLTGALGRLVVGGASDALGTRVGLIRVIAVAACALTAGLALVSLTSLPVIASIVFVLASTVSVADNGLAFASVAEAAGPRWSGKALGAQNTGQFAVSALVGPGLGALITVLGYPLSFAIVAVFPLIGAGLVPKGDIDRIT